MISIHTLALLVAVARLCNQNVHAESLLHLPYIPRDGNSTSRNTMVRGMSIEPLTYVDLHNGTATLMRNGKAIGHADMLNSATDNNENNDIGSLEALYKFTFIRNAEEIAQKWPRGQLQKTPWPGSYWPIYQDSINVRWNGGPSPAEKYARSHDLNVQEFMNKVSLSSGIDSTQKNAFRSPPCREKSDCNGGQAVCAKRQGKESGYCVATWEGLCHAWAPAALLEDEPKCPVRIGHVTFQPNDIKALITEVYHSADTGALGSGLRFDGGDNNAKDEFGRYIDYSHRDMNPAVFHLICANLLGKTKTGFIVDVDAGAQVWNHPVRSYEFTTLTTMEPNKAAQRFFHTATYPFNPEAKKVQYVRNTFRYIVEPTTYNADGELSAPELVDGYTKTAQYDYLLELDHNNTIIGGEWVGDTRYDKHPDFLWIRPERPKDNFVSPAGISYAFVRKLVLSSRQLNC